MYLRDTIAVDMRLLGYGDMLRAYRLYRVYHTCGALSREFFRDLVPPFLSTCSRLIARQVPRMPWHPVPSRAASVYLRAGALTCSRLISYVIYKETAFGFGCLFWLHQGGIPHRMCRFYCCLAAHQRTRKKDSAEPSFPMEPRLRGSLDSTSSTLGYPLRRENVGCRG